MQEGGIKRGHDETFGFDGHVLDYDNGSTGMYICQNVSVVCFK